MRPEDLHSLLEELVAYPAETEWIEFKLGAGSITNDQIGEYISAMSNGATIKNKPFGYLAWGVKDDTHKIKGTNFSFYNCKTRKSGFGALGKKSTPPQNQFQNI
jgi:predicted HTH transcriptional regulator